MANRRNSPVSWDHQFPEIKHIVCAIFAHGENIDKKFIDF
jgi:hypothetical protein